MQKVVIVYFEFAQLRQATACSLPNIRDTYCVFIVIFCFFHFMHLKENPTGHIKHIVFDLDGTLIDSAPSILAGFAAALAEHGISPALPLNDTLIGPPLKETLKRLTGRDEAELIEALAQAFKAHYDTSGYQASAVYPGIPELLQSLRAQGYTLHIATNKRLLPTEKILNFLAWDSYFANVYALDKVSPAFANKAAMITGLLQTAAIDPLQAIYVGDKAEDGEAAHANQLPFIAVHWGYGDFSGNEAGCLHAQVSNDILTLLRSEVVPA